MKRKIITIDRDKCNGCGLCVNACHEGAIGLEDGRAKLMREDYCDGLGDCLPACPTGAITFEEREAKEYDHEAVLASKGGAGQEAPFVCPGTRMKTMNHRPAAAEVPAVTGEAPSQLGQWPVQIQLVPPRAPFFDQANLLVAADCAAYAYAGFHNKFMKNRITVIGCPKLDEVDYAEKLTAILTMNEIRSVTVVRMEVPCCGGIENAVKRALQASGKMIPWRVVTLSTDGSIIEE